MSIYYGRNKIFKPVVNSLCLLIVGLFVFSGSLSAYDFSDVRRSLKKDVNLLRPNNHRNKIAIVYNYSDRESIKRRFNLVKLKKDLSHELAKSFEVADPVIVQRIMSSNNLSYAALYDDDSLFKKFADRVDCSMALMVDLNLRSGVLAGSMTLLDSAREPVSSVDLEIPEEPEESDFKPIQEQTGGSFFDGFSSPFAEKQTDSWMYFVPSALIGANQHSLTLSLSFRDLAEVDIQPNYLRYDFSFAETLQFGVQSHALNGKVEDEDDIKPKANLESDKGHHSTYASIKYRIIDESVLPVNVALGLRARLAWDEDNVEFNTEKLPKTDDKEDAKEIDDHNKRLNALTLQAIVTGEIRQLGLMYNFYLDNQTTAAGARFFVLPSVRLTGDFIYYWHKDPVVQSDAAFGVEILNRLGVTGLNYQWETAQVQLEMIFNF